MINNYKHAAGATSPAIVAAPVTPNDGADLSEYYRALYIGVAGDLTCQMMDDTQVTFANVPAGLVLPARVKRVLATGTTADSIVGLS